MLIKRSLIPCAVVFAVLQCTAAGAQNVQGWAANEANKIQQDAASGFVNQGQAAKLENRDAQIQGQVQRDLTQNGGFLTPQQQSQIGSEMRRLNSNVRRDVRKDNPNLPAGYTPSGYPPNGFAPNGFVPNGYVPGAYPNNGYVPAAAVPPGGYVPAQNGYAQPAGAPRNGYGHHHHHHDGMNGYGSNGANGFNGSTGQQYWGH